jgi:teichuronic acid biosynthesis glycosyltransferase TuaC
MTHSKEQERNFGEVSKKLRYKKLLIFSWFPDESGSDSTAVFVKDQVEVLKRYFEEIIVIDPIPYFPDPLVGMLPEYIKRHVSKRDYSYDNVSVYFPKYLRLPKVFGKKKTKFDELRFRAADKLILKKGLKFDLIHAHFTFPGGYIGVRASKKYKKPLITTVHENYEWFFKEINSGDPEIYRVWEKSDLLLTINQKDIGCLKRWNENALPVKNGYSVRKFKTIKNAKELLGIAKGSKLVLSIGSLMKKKGHRYLIEAMKSISADVNCVIIGEGPLEGQLQKQIMSSGLSGRVKIENRKSEEELNLWMNACDVFVLPSLSESFGIVQLEAMACGKPVVATRNGGSEYILTPEVGILTDRGDSEKLAISINEALERKWDGKAIAGFAKGFDWETVSNKLLNEYCRLI